MKSFAVVKRLERQPPGYRYSIGRIVAIYCGLMVIVLMASLDQTIVATALPHIVSDLGGLSSYSWVFSAYLLCQTITVPIYGKLGDSHGRRRVLFVAITIFLVGSACCGAAENMTQLVLFRGLQGLGAGGLMPLVGATVGEIVPPRERGRYQGFFSAALTTSAVMGPAAGGLIVDNTTWRWIFYINLPIGAMALLVVALAMPKHMPLREHSIDYVGAALLAGGTGAFLFGLVLGGDGHPWSSVGVVGPFVASVVLLVGFSLVERRVREPILSLALLRRPVVGAAALAQFLAATCMLGTIAFVPLFVQGVIGGSATSSGIVLTPFMLGGMIGSIASGQWVSRTGHYRISALLGVTSYGVGMTLLWRMNVTTSDWEAARNMFVAGTGVGLMMIVYTIAAQNAVTTRVIGTTTALLQFSQAIGMTLGVTIFGVIVSHGAPPSIGGHAVITHRLSPSGREQLSNALHPAFLLQMCVCVALLATVFFGLKEHSLRDSVEDPPGPETSAAAAGYVSSAVPIGEAHEPA